MILLLLIGLAPLSARSSQPIYTFHAFAGSDGASSQAPLVQDKAGNFYGIASQGGAYGGGTVFKIAPDGTFTTLHDFSALPVNSDGTPTTNADGAQPVCLIFGSDANLYGVAAQGGANGDGVLFQITPAGAFTPLHIFSTLTHQIISVPGGTTSIYTNADGAQPEGLTLGLDGNLYGVAAQGGTNGNGTVFQITTAGAFATLHTFSAYHWNQPLPYEQQTDLINADGANPQTPLARSSDGNLYGIAPWGGPNGSGTIFKITTGGVLTALHSYGGGYLMRASMTTALPATERITLHWGIDGSFYGTTEGRKVQPRFDFGSLFKMTPGGAITVLYGFTGPANDGTNADGFSPRGGVIQASDGSLYGTTTFGGEDGLGTIFHITPDGTLTTLYSFLGFDGASPQASMLLSRDGNLYGTAGVVFEVSPTPAKFHLYDFNGADGFAPLCVLQARDGDFYGVTYSSIPRGIGAGTVFHIHLQNDTAQLTTLHEFPYAQPNLPLIQGQDDAFYGTTSAGGTDGDHVYRVTATGDYSLVFNFAGKHDTDGGFPMAGVIQARDGNFYGTTSRLGLQGNGTLFQLTPSGSLKVLHAFSYNGFEGYDPTTPLMQSRDGNLYGINNYGGAAANSIDGTVFKITTQGVLTTLHQFNFDMAESFSPYGALVEDKHGFLYGVTHGGGRAGIIFKLPETASQPSDLTPLHTFSNSEGGQSSGLLAASDGNFYGLLGAGGSTFTGSVYKITPEGEFAILYRFHGPDGIEPFSGSLIEGSDGNLYGVARSGGANGYIPGTSNGFGTFFRLAIGRPKTATLLQVANAAGTVGHAVALRALLRSKADGSAPAGRTVDFTVNGASAGTATTDSQGNARLSYSVPGMFAGNTVPFTASFTGDNTYNPTTSAAGTLTVQKADVYLIVGTATGKLGQTVLLRALLRRIPDALLLSGKTVTFKVDGTTVGTAVSAANGLASYSYTIAVGATTGSHTLTASFAGDNAYNPTTSAAGTLTVQKADIDLTVGYESGKPGQSVPLRALLRRIPDALLLSGKTVTFKVDGVTVGTAVSGSSGLASYSYVIPAGTTPGSHTITATFAGDSGYNAAFGTNTLTVNP